MHRNKSWKQDVAVSASRLVDREAVARVDREEIAKMFRCLGGGASESSVSILERNGARPINKDALAETAGGSTGQLKHLLK